MELKSALKACFSEYVGNNLFDKCPINMIRYGEKVHKKLA